MFASCPCDRLSRLLIGLGSKTADVLRREHPPNNPAGPAASQPCTNPYLSLIPSVPLCVQHQCDRSLVRRHRSRLGPNKTDAQEQSRVVRSIGTVSTSAASRKPLDWMMDPAHVCQHAPALRCSLFPSGPTIGPKGCIPWAINTATLIASWSRHQRRSPKQPRNN